MSTILRVSQSIASVNQQPDYLSGSGNVYMSANNNMNYLMVAPPSSRGASPSSGSPALGRKESVNQIIHSGHFMVSEIEDAGLEEQAAQAAHESDYEQPDAMPTEQAKDFDLESACQETTQKYIYGPQSSQMVMIDASLSKLFEYMTLSFSGKLTSPKWKTFKGLRLKLKDKIRLNNIIWRAWHIQYIMGRSPTVCQFAITVDCDMHNKPEAVVLEGKYWKRRLATVTAEYQKWRMYHKEKTYPKPGKMTPISDSRWPELFPCNSLPGSQLEDDFSMDFTDTALFSTLLPPNLIDFPNPREIARSGYAADCIQPGLTQLQPSFDEYMEFEDLFMSSKGLSILPTLQEESTAETNADMSVAQSSKPNQQQQQQNQSEGRQQFSNSLNDFTSSPAPGVQNNNYLKSSNKSSATQSARRSTPMFESGISSSFRGDSFSQSKATNAVQLPMAPMGQMSATQLVSSNSQVPQQVDSVAISENATPNFYTSATPSLHEFSVDASSFQGLLDEKKPLKVNSDFGHSSNTQKGHFAVPKLPVKQRIRSRSVSGPHSGRKHGTSVPPQGALSMSDLHQPKSSSHSVERSVSLPGYSNHTNHSSYSSRKSNQMTRTLSSSAMRTALAADAQSSNQQNNGSVICQTLLTSSPDSHLQHLHPRQSQAQSQSQGSTGFAPNFSESSSLIAQLLSTNSGPTASAINRTDVRARVSFLEQPVAQFPTFSPASGLNTALDLPGSSTVVSVQGNGRSSQRNKSTSGSLGTRSLSPQTVMFTPVKLSEDGMSHNMGSSTPVRKLSSPARICSPLVTSNLPPLSLTRDYSPTSSSMPSPQSSVASPPSSLKSLKPKSDEERIQYKEHRRVCHINAEQKRRCNIKNGFDTLRAILPSLSQNANTKISKAAMLSKGAEYIRTLKADRQQQQEEYDLLKQEIESLNQTIGVFQNQLPATGAPVSCQRTGQTKELFESYVRQRTQENWKFWMFSIIMEPLLESYDSTVTTSNVDEMCKSMTRWLDQSCSLVTLRRDVLNSLRKLSTSTNILTDPASLPEEAIEAVSKKERKRSE